MPININDWHCAGDRTRTLAKRRQYYFTQLGRTLNFSSTDYDSLLETQSRLCAICKGPSRNGKALAIDHNHDTGFIRGLLCNNCNAGLGMFKDDINLLITAVEYLQKARDKELDKKLKV